MRLILSIFLFAALIFGNQKITNPETGEEISLYNKSWAVIIGVNKYEHVKPLDYCVADANSIESLLIENFDFNPNNVIMLTNQEATLEGIRNAFDHIMKEAGKDDRVLIYFAGHGFTEELPDGVGEIGYLVPYDGKEEDAYLTCLPMEELRTVSQRSSARQVMFLVDACHGGLAAINTRSLSSNSKHYIKKIAGMKARQIISAGGKDDKVMEKAEWGHSAFTYKLIHGLKDGLADQDEDNIITASELYTFLRRSVTTLSGYIQTPRFNYLSNDEGEFIFTLKKEEKGAITPTMTAVEDIASADKFGTLIINTIPSIARVSIDNKYIGDTPFEQLVPQGQYLFKIEKENYDPEITIISVKEGIEKNIEIPLSYTRLFIDKSINQYQKNIQNQKVIQYGSLFISVLSAYLAYDSFQAAQTHYNSYSEAIEAEMIDQSYDAYLSEYKSSNLYIGISFSTTLITGWTFLKPVIKPEFID